MDEIKVPTTTLDQLPDPLPEDIRVLDVREDHEWAEGHIAAAVHIRLGELADREGELDPSVKTVVVCHLGGRSARATAFLEAHGHDVVNLEGGMEAWEEANRPTAS